MTTMASARNPVSVLLKLMKRNYKNLTDARETFEVISNRMGVLDNPQELVAFLGQHLKPKELEKKKNGEVFTSPDLIQQKFNKLTLADPQIWSDPSKKFLDPANGIGNYPALAFHRLMEGLKNAIPNEAYRKKHILENMLYMCELNKKNIEVSRKVFDPENLYALNLYQGSYLDLDPYEEWGVEKFDAILGNPPYQDSTGNKGVGHMLWVTFVNKSLSLLNENGFLVFVHPAGWRQPGNDILEKFKNLQMHHLSIHDENDGYSTFHCNTRYDWYVVQNCKNYKKTNIECQDKTIVDIDITTLPFIPNYDFNLIQALTNSPTKCTIVHSESAYECRKPWISKTKNGEFVNPVVYSVNRQNTEKLRWSKRTDRGHFGIPKVIFGSGATGFIIDETGKYGLTQWAKAISDDVTNLKQICDVLNSVEFMKVIRACSVGKAEINIKVLRLFNKDFWKHFQTLTTTLKIKPTADATTIAGQVNEIVNVEPVAQPVAQPDYKKMKVADLKQLCKDRKIKGITGKSKEELIAMLNA
jgi:Eco57I restriction-modification methylase